MSARTRESVPPLRLRACNDAPIDERGELVLYWMIAARRPRWNFALERAVELAADLDRPLVVLEPLRAGYPFASDRLHRFVLDGMRDQRAAFADGPALYHPYVEPEPGAGKGLVEALARRACAVVTDDLPVSFLPRMVAAAARKLRVRFEAVDSNGLLPLRATERVFTTAFSFRAFLQRELPSHLEEQPAEHPLRGRRLARLEALPAEIARRWPAASEALLEAEPDALAALPIDHAVPPAPTRGGARAGSERLAAFLERGLERYQAERNDPGSDASSRLSPYLHFGHVSAHQVLAAVAEREGWSPGELSGPHGGKREGWWGMSAPAEAFLDELVTWRELGLNRCAHTDDYDRYDSLPDWARETLAAHADDPRETYTLRQLERAETHDELWNAAQRQLVREGFIHNYLRMLWGKKILEWSPSPREAARRMIQLNDRWALDGRDPNSYSGIFWVLGRYDRPWGPERPIFGKVRYMSSESAARKLRLGDYLERYGERARAAQGELF